MNSNLNITAVIARQDRSDARARVERDERREERS